MRDYEGETMGFVLVFSSFSLTSWYPAYPAWLRPPCGARLYALVRVSCCLCLLSSPSCSGPLCDHTESSVFVHQHSSPWNPACLFWVLPGGWSREGLAGAAGWWEGFGSDALCRQGEGISSYTESTRHCILNLSTPCCFLGISSKYPPDKSHPGPGVYAFHTMSPGLPFHVGLHLTLLSALEPTIYMPFFRSC